jgi:general nucleoside transport system permease protein
MRKRSQFSISLVAITIGILVGVIVLTLTGKNPLLLFVALLRSTTGYYLMNGTFSLRYFGEFLVTATPIILTGLSVGFAYRTGLFNIGAEGQVMMGAAACTFVALKVPEVPYIHWLLALLAAALAGGLWAGIPGFLKAKFKVHEVVICIMLNYTAFFLANYIVETIDPNAVGIRRTIGFSPSTLISARWLEQLTDGSRLNYGIIIALLCVVVFWFIIEKTTFGYSLRATGFNKEGANFAGIKTDRNVFLSMMIAGMFAGLAGATLAQGVFGYGRVLAAFENYGFDGIAVAFVGGGNALGIMLAGFLFSMLKNAQQTLQVLGLTKDIVNIISATIIMAIAMKWGIEQLLDRFKKAEVKVEAGGDSE